MATLSDLACGCKSTALEELASQLGMPSPSYGFYEAVSRIAASATSGVVGGPIVTGDSSTTNLSGAGTAESPLVASLAPGAITSPDGSVTVTTNPDGTIGLSVDDLGVVTEDTATIELSGDGTEADPLIASLAPGAITSVDGTVTVTEGPDGVVDLSVLGTTNAIATTDTASIDLTGDGTLATPLSATLTPGALTSPGGTITVTPGPGGVFSLDVAAGVVTADTASIDLAGDGTAGSPLTATLTPGAITSPDGTITVTSGAGGVVELSATAAPISTVDTATIDLSGDGTAGNPLSADLAAGALTSPGGTVTITQLPSGVFQLEATGSAPTFTSSDSSITITPPAAPGDPYDLVAASTFTGSPTVSVVETPGTGVTPPNYTFSIPPTAIVGSTNPALTPVTVDTSTGVFQLGVAGLGSFIPLTVVVGGTIGTTPSAPDLPSAIALLPPPPFGNQPWTLLFMPGVYAGGPVAIPAGINMVALEKDSVIIDHPMTMSDTSATNFRSTFNDLIIAGAFTFDMLAKPDGLAALRVVDCRWSSQVGTTAGLITLNMRPQSSVTPPVAGTYRDQVSLEGCEIDSSMALSGGILNVRDCRTLLTSLVVSATAPSVIGKMQVVGGSFSATTFNMNSSALATYSYAFLGCAIGGDWTVGGTNTSIVNCFIHACIPAGVPPGGLGGTFWRMTVSNTVSRVQITDTPLYYLVTRTAPATWTVSQPQLVSVGGGSVDRDLKFTMAAAPQSTVPVTATITLTTPYRTPLVATMPGTYPATQPEVCWVDASGANTIIVDPATTTSVVTLTYTGTAVTGTLPLQLGIEPPAPDATIPLWYM